MFEKYLKEVWLSDVYMFRWSRKRIAVSFSCEVAGVASVKILGGGDFGLVRAGSEEEDGCLSYPPSLSRMPALFLWFIVFRAPATSLQSVVCQKWPCKPQVL